MRYLQHQLYLLQEKVRTIDFFNWREFFRVPSGDKIREYKGRILSFFNSIKVIGAYATMDDYEKRKLSIFNQLNFFQLVTGICIPAIGLMNHSQFPTWVWLVTGFPAIISLLVFWMNAHNSQESAILFYFIAHPIAISLVYMSGVNEGMELFFILYGILSVFFLQELSYMVFSVTFNMISYFMLAIVLKDYRYQLQDSNMTLYLFNQLVGILFIFYGLFLIKSENTGYQTSILSKNEEIARNSELLQEQTRSLTEANAVKNKLFSVIAHDLKIPMYALRNLFINIREQNLPAKEIKAMLPDVIINLNHTTGLMENLLQWAKSQMNAENIHPEELDIAGLIRNVEKLLHLQAASKDISLVCPTADCVMVVADKDSIHLVLRNLLTNAIKFTPNGGIITISLREIPGSVEISVKDSGVGMSKENLDRINRNDTFTTNGTAHEPGTGLGLMLCKDFLVKNKSHLSISSEKEKGSVFSFVLPAAE